VSQKANPAKLIPSTSGRTFTASHRHASLSPYKARPVIDLVRGKNVDDALSILEWQDRRAAPMIRKVIKSALANATNDLEADLKRLFVADARVDGAGLLNGRKRFMQRAMGRAFPILKRTCHISIVLAEAAESVADEARSKARKARTKKSAGSAPAAAGTDAAASAGKKE
jgi:large subunit ribosomal protein L22